MKSIIVILCSFIMFACTPLNQVSNVSTNYGYAPQWGPAGYDDARFYYLPDIEVYYDIQYNVFIYYYRNSWVRRSYLPSQYRNYDLYRAYKVVVTDYAGDSPYSNFNTHKLQYKKGYRDSDQKNIGVRSENSDYQRKTTNNPRSDQKVISTDRKRNIKVKPISTPQKNEPNRDPEKKSNNKKSNNSNGRR